MKPHEQPPYQGQHSQLILRDHLAIDRTRLANERTLLAWWRTGLTLLIAGASAIKIFHDSLWVVVAGYMLLPFGFAALAIGLHRYLRLRRIINASDN
jgi:putative membrane protein